MYHTCISQNQTSWLPYFEQLLFEGCGNSRVVILNSVVHTAPSNHATSFLSRMPSTSQTSLHSSLGAGPKICSHIQLNGQSRWSPHLLDKVLRSELGSHRRVHKKHTIDRFWHSASTCHDLLQLQHVLLFQNIWRVWLQFKGW